MEFLSNPDIWIAFLTLCALEIVLGIDNLIFISILASKLPEAQQARARQVGLSLALITRVALLFSISWIMSLTNDLFTVRFKVSGEFIMPAHTHPKDERVTILQGKAYVAFGKGATKADAKAFATAKHVVATSRAKYNRPFIL